MTFASLRQAVLQAHALSGDLFAEDVELTSGGGVRTVRAKVTHQQTGPRPSARGAAGEVAAGGFDERERIEVLVSRDPTFARSLPTRPQPGDKLQRSETRDSDRRAFAFAGDVVFEGDQHAVYVFERPRRVAQGKR